MILGDLIEVDRSALRYYFLLGASACKCWWPMFSLEEVSRLKPALP